MDMVGDALARGDRRARRLRTHSRSKNTNTRCAPELRRDHVEFYEALKLAATGVTHLMAKDKDGTWARVTDPEVMVKVLNSGESFYRLSARNPDSASAGESVRSALRLGDSTVPGAGRRATHA